MRLLLTLLGAGLLAAAPSGAQTAKPKAGTVAGIAPTSAPAPSNDGRRHDDRDDRNGHGRASVQVLPDGRVFADFGHGYEQVVRSCGAPVPAAVAAAPVPASVGSTPGSAPPGTTQPASAPLPFGVTRPNSAQVPFGVTQPAPYTPPVPAQPTASQQAAQPAASSMAAQSCWTADASGRVFIVHP